jgi:cell migration-inducing and hyaluronan-binding protein
MSFQHRFVAGLGVEKRTYPPRLLGRILLALTLLVLGTQAAQAVVQTCSGGVLPGGDRASPPDLLVTGRCVVPLNTTLYYGNVNIVAGGLLLFYEDYAQADSKTHFWASSIIIENGGVLSAYGRDRQPVSLPFGIKGGVLTIHLYGKNEAEWNSNTQRFVQQNQGALCKSQTPAPCGIPQTTWESNGASKVDLPSLAQGKQINDYFYKYGPLHGDARCTKGVYNKATGECSISGGEVGYFGNKVLAVSYGGTLSLFGYKGATIPAPDPVCDADPDCPPLNSRTSWMRLADGSSLEVGADRLVLERDPGTWQAGDEIVVTTTDYIPGHSEKLQIASDYKGGTAVFFAAVDSASKKIQWPHNGVRYGGPMHFGSEFTNRLPDRLKKNIDDKLVHNGAETRAAVALLSRSIRIVSAGDAAGEDFPAETSGYSYGAHMVIRQGFNEVQIRGVEFVQMGQGGRLGHYPIHFHMARQTPANTYVKDSSVNESMTRWIVLHSTLGVTLQRNVGYKSIGHGFYLEDGTETDNKFYSNIGIFARAAVDNIQNPRKIPGILADNQNPAIFVGPSTVNPGFPYRSDSEYPSVFWITNGWNDLIGNMAAGAGTCGAAYWFVPAANSDMVEVGSGHKQMIWSGYAALQRDLGYAGTTPLKSFYDNYATSTMHSFQTTSDAPPCDGVLAADVPRPADRPTLQAVPSISPKPERATVQPPGGQPYTIPDNFNDHYYPHVIGGARRATQCVEDSAGYDCSGVPPCAHGQDADKDPAKQCAVVVLDHFTSSFHWAHGNISAIWLRPQWYLLTNSVLSDVQNGGLTFISGGDYTHASVIRGYWALARNTVFIGNTRNNETYGFASNLGPFNNSSGLKCDQVNNSAPVYCLSAAEGISMPTSGFFTNQRLSNIYDGPSYQDSNVYLDIIRANCPLWSTNNKQSECMYGSTASYLRLKETPKSLSSACYLPNAAIGWKQPNAFFYPPAFHSKNLFFDNVDIRHFVINPLFEENTYKTDQKAVSEQYCLVGQPAIFNSAWTSIDRQTELNDDDGSLTGLSNSLPAPGQGQPDNPLKQTISVNDDPFFSAPVETPECASAIPPSTSAANACTAPPPNQPPPTAKTSPYDYISTVVYHPPYDAPYEGWGSSCSNENCYGVPLYRQYLTGTKDPDKKNSTREWKRWQDNGCDVNGSKQECRWPFIRMAGADISQRETLTVNNGLYFLDTTVSKEVQQTEKFKHPRECPRDNPQCEVQVRSVNVFKGDKTYHMFFVYAKRSSRQKYQIFVGKSFNQTNGFKQIRMIIETKQLTHMPPITNKVWATPDYSRVADQGILTVDVNFADLETLDPTSKNGLCRPRTFCQPQGDSCVSALNENDRLYAESNAVCRNWAVKDLDCPLDGCPGFSFTLPQNFEIDAKGYHRPAPIEFPTGSDNQGKPDWTTTFRSVPRDDAPKSIRPWRVFDPPNDYPGRCYYEKLPGTKDCPVP